MLSDIAPGGGTGRRWSSRLGFVLAAVGSSVGLGNFWRFPYTAGENGGGAFLIAYIICVAVIVLPILMAEYALGRRSRCSAVEGLRKLAIEEDRSGKWCAAGLVGMFAAIFILSFYNVICAWILAFIPQAATGSFASYGSEAAYAGLRVSEYAAAKFEATIGNQSLILVLLAGFIAANVGVVAAGIKGGIERAAKVLMPLFFLALALMVIYAARHGDLAQAATFLLQPKWSDVGFGTILAAIGQAFFSVGVGASLMLTYGSYIPDEIDIPRSSAIIAGCDTLVALIAGFAVFPIVFAFGGAAAGGPGLFFISMPIAFGEMSGGALLGTVFFCLALFAAFTSSISLLEVPVAWFAERPGVSRGGAAAGLGVALFLVGAGYVFSLPYLDFVDFITEGLLLPLGGLLIAIVAGHVLSPDIFDEQLGRNLPYRLLAIWYFLLRWIVPIFVGIVLVLGFIDRLQDSYGAELPAVLTMLLGPNRAGGA